MVVESFVAKRESVDALLHQLLDRMRDAHRAALVGKAGGEPAQNVGPALDLAQQQSAAVTDNMTTVKTAHHFAWADAFERN